MRPGGLLLVVAGVWVLCQVMGGKALQRLGVVAGDDADKPKGDLEDLLPPKPNDPYGPGYRDGEGRPL